MGSPRWAVRRQDDNGNTFHVSWHGEQAQADQVAATLEARGHKQHYWVERAPPPGHDAESLAQQLREGFIDRSFGAVRFWGMAVLPPNDARYILVSTHHQGSRLDLVFVHAGRMGLPGVLSIHDPGGLELSEDGLILRAATTLSLDGWRVTREGERVLAETPRGPGEWAAETHPALTLG